MSRARAVDMVPGDVVQLEAGDIVPADGRILRSATLEAQEAALTGESAPVAKDAGVLRGRRRRARRPVQHAVPEHVGHARHRRRWSSRRPAWSTEMGRIATMLTSVTRTRSPLQRELDSLTKVLGVIAWTAVAFIVVVGAAARPAVRRAAAARHRDGDLGDPDRHAGVRLGPARRSAPSNWPRRKAVVKNLTDVETLGATSAINTDKTGTLTMNEMMVSALYAGGTWFRVDGRGLRKTGRDRVGRRRAGARTSPGWRSGSSLDSDATVGDDGSGGRRSDRGGARRARGQAGRRRRGDPAGVPAAGRGAVRLRVQVHGHLPPRRRSTARST